MGLLPFKPEDSDFFFGRQAEAEVLRLNAVSAPSTLIYGPSGVGKSSLINAGLLPLLSDRDDVLAVSFREWSNTPLPGILETISAVAASKLPGWTRNPAHSLAETLAQVADDLAASLDDPDELVQRPGRVVIIFDQFDEYIINHSLQPETEQELTQAFARPHPSVAVLLSIREDWLARLDRFRGVFPTLFDNFIRIEPLTSAGALAAIHGPLERYALLHPNAGGPQLADDDLAKAVLEQVTRTQTIGEGPALGRFEVERSVDTAFLQVVLQRLWLDECKAHSTSLRLATLQRLGDASQILDDHLASVFDTLSSKQQDQAVEIFDRLVTPSETKIAQSAGDLATYLNAGSAELESILDTLAAPDARILRSFAPRERPDTKLYELYHDLLAKPVRSWLVGRRVEAQVDAFLVKRGPPQAEAARQILGSLFAGPATTQGLATATGLPEATVDEVCRALVEIRVVTSEADAQRWSFRPGRGYRETLFRAPYDEFLTTRKSRETKFALGASSVALVALALVLGFSHPLGWLGRGVVGQLFDATLVLAVAAILGAVLHVFIAWWLDEARGLVTRGMQRALPKVILFAAALSVGVVATFYYPIAYLSGNGGWLLGTATLWLGGFTLAAGAVYSTAEFVPSTRVSSRRVPTDGRSAR